MVSLFRKRKQVDAERSQGPLVPWLNAHLMRFQKRWADGMQRLMEKLSVRGRKVTVVALCIVSAGYCSGIIYQSFHRNDAGLFSVTSIQTPAHVTQTGDAHIANGIMITERAYRQMSGFRKYIDSLMVSAAGKHIADSLLFLRPGLMDSIYQLEQLYQLQQSKIK